MTTIAWDGKTLAGDTQTNHEPIIIPGKTRKIFKLRDGRLVGISGVVSEFPSFLHYLESGESSGQLDVSALVVQGKQCMYYEGTRPSYLKRPPAAIGTGTGYALAAMMAGADAKKAVQIACKLDPSSGGQVMTLNCALDGLVGEG